MNKPWDKWSNLKAWTRIGIIVGAVHFALYSILFLLGLMAHGESGVGLLMLFMELPWIVVLALFRVNLDRLVPVPFGAEILMGVIGSFFYGWVAMLLAKITMKKPAS